MPKTQPKTLPVCAEGPEAYQRFDITMRALLTVPHSVIVRREKAYKKQRAKIANRPGPKPKLKPSASRVSRAKG